MGQFQFLGEVSDRASPDKWTVTLDIGDAPRTFKIDITADVTVTSEKTFQTLPKSYRLGSAEIPFVGPGGELECIG